MIAPHKSMEKEFDPEDPMELVGVSLPEGNVNDMAECFVEEYIRDGWDDESLLRLFRDPFYRATHRIYLEKGETYVLDLVARLRKKWGRPGGDPSRAQDAQAVPEPTPPKQPLRLRRLEATMTVDPARRFRLDEIKKQMLQEVKNHA